MRHFIEHLECTSSSAGGAVEADESVLDVDVVDEAELDGEGVSGEGEGGGGGGEGAGFEEKGKRIEIGGNGVETHAGEEEEGEERG